MLPQGSPEEILQQKSKAQSDDEIGDLAVMIEGFKKILIGTAEDLEKAHKK